MVKSNLHTMNCNGQASIWNINNNNLVLNRILLNYNYFDFYFFTDANQSSSHSNEPTLYACSAAPWTAYSTYTPYTSQTGYYDGHQEGSHGTSLHLPTGNTFLYLIHP